MARKMAIVVLAGLMVMALAACDTSDAEITLYGPDSVAKSAPAFYTVVTTGVTPLLAIVTYQPYVDLDGDKKPDWNERLTESPMRAAADRFGVASAQFGFTPKAFFAAHKVSVPSSTTVMVISEIYWNDPSTTVALGMSSKELKITSK